MFKKIIHKTKGISDKADISRKVRDARQKIKGLSQTSKAVAQVAGDRMDEGKVLINDAFEKNWKEIEKVVLDGLLDISEDKLQDDDWLTSLFENAYETLPMVARFALRRDKFIEFCMQRKELILAKIVHHRDEKADAVCPTIEAKSFKQKGIESDEADSEE